MHRDVKIGLVFGLALLLLVVIYFSLGDNDSQKPQDQIDTVVQKGPLFPTGGVPVTGGDSNEIARIADKSYGNGQVPVEPGIAETSSPSSSDSVFVTPQYEPIIAPVTEPPATSARTDRWAVATEVLPDKIRPIIAPTATKLPVVEPAVSPAPGIAGPVAAQRIYTVKLGDAGFWVVAEKVYGAGKHWPLIARANPEADSSMLRAGQKLVIPPLSQHSAVRSRIVRRPTPASGEKLYVVRKGDSGFWTVAEKMYGAGKYWPVVAKANPQVASSALRPGQTLVIPPLGTREVLRTTPRAAPTAVGPNRIYTVQAGDAGFWGISLKVYKDGKHFELIAAANPGVDPYKLRPGQKLIVPSLPKPSEADRTAPPSDRAESPKKAAENGRPVFD